MVSQYLFLGYGFYLVILCSLTVANIHTTYNAAETGNFVLPIKNSAKGLLKIKLTPVVSFLIPHFSFLIPPSSHLTLFDTINLNEQLSPKTEFTRD